MEAHNGVPWSPFDPGETPALPSSGDGSGRIVAVVADPELVGGGWAVSVTSELARAWADPDRVVVLVDTDLDRPRLHHQVRVDNETGLAEILAGDASVAQATRLIEEDRLYCVPAGNAPLDGSDGFDPVRWNRFCHAFSTAGVTVVAYVPVEALWLSWVVERATDIVYLRERYRADLVRGSDDRIRAILGPMPLMRPSADPTGKEPRSSAAPLLSFDPEQAEDELGALDELEDGRPLIEAEVVLPGTQEVFTGEAPSSVEPESSDGDQPRHPAPEIGILPRERRDHHRRKAETARRKRRDRRIIVATAFAVGAAAFWMAFVFGRGPEATASSPLDPGALVPTAGAPDASVPRPLPLAGSFSVAIAAYSEAERAEERRNQLSLAIPDVGWTIAPVQVGEASFYRLLAGLLPDEAAARDLGGRLEQAGWVASGSWVVRSTLWVFDFGESATPAAADALLNRVRAAGIPADIAQVRYSDQSFRYRVYAGGYADVAEGAYMAGVIEAAGLDADWVQRGGLPPS